MFDDTIVKSILEYVNYPFPYSNEENYAFLESDEEDENSGLYNSQRKYNKDNRNLINFNARQYYQDNKDAINARNRARYQANKEKYKIQYLKNKGLNDKEIITALNKMIKDNPLKEIEKAVPKGYKDFESTTKFLNYIRNIGSYKIKFPADAYIQFINPNNLKYLAIWVTILESGSTRFILYASRPFIYRQKYSSREFVKWVEKDSDLEEVREQPYREAEGLKIDFKVDRSISMSSLYRISGKIKMIIDRISSKGFTVLPLDDDPRSYL